MQYIDSEKKTAIKASYNGTIDDMNPPFNSEKPVRHHFVVINNLYCKKAPGKTIILSDLLLVKMLIAAEAAASRDQQLVRRHSPGGRSDRDYATTVTARARSATGVRI